MNCPGKVSYMPMWLLLLVLLLAGGRIPAHAAEKAAPVNPVDGSFAREWLILGPFASRDMETDFLSESGGEENIRPKEGDTVTTKDGRELVWTRVRSQHDTIDIEQVLGLQEWGIVYAYCELMADRTVETDVQIVSMASRTLWLNGIEIEQPKAARTRTDDLHPATSIRLQKGLNAFLLKLKLQSLQPWGFAVQPLPGERVKAGLKVTADGKPVGGALVQFYDQGEPIARLLTDSSGRAEAVLYPVAESYDVRITSGEAGSWLQDLNFLPGEKPTVEVVLEESISISGTVLAMDGSPQNAIVVQALRVSEEPVSRPSSRRPRNGTHEPQLNSGEYATIPSVLPMPPFSDTVLSDAQGNFRFINLRPGQYRLRAHGLHDYVEPKLEGDTQHAATFAVLPGRSNTVATFVMPEVKKGIWNEVPITQGLMELQPGRIHRTPDGILWVGTEEGTLHSYDGVEVQMLASPALPRGTSHVIHHDDQGGLWVGTHMGLARISTKQGEASVVNAPFWPKGVNFIESDPGGVVWISTTSGLYKYDGQQFVRWTPNEGAPSYEIGALLRTAEGNYWLSTRRSLAQFDGKKFSEPVLLSGIRSPAWERLYQARDGAIWFCSSAHEVAAYRYDGKTLSRLGEADGLLSYKIQRIAQTSDGVLWFATDKGLSRFNGRTIVNYTTTDGLSAEDIRDIFVDADDVLWCAAAPGFARFEPNQFAEISARDGLLDKAGETPGVFAIEPDPKGGYLLGTEWGGVYHLGAEGKSLTQVAMPEEYVRRVHRTEDGSFWFGASDGLYKQTIGGATKVLDRNWIIALNSDEHGNLWFGHGWGGGGISRYNPKTGEEITFTRADGLPEDFVWAIGRGLRGEMWIGTSGGLAQFRDQKIINVGEQIGFPAEMVTSFQQDRHDSLWIGSDIGLFQLTGTNLISVNGAGNTRIEGVWCTARTSDGILWIGTDKTGLLGYDGQAVTMLDKRDGLPGNRVISLRTDSDDSLIVGFIGDGVSRYRRTKSAPAIRLIQATLQEQTFTEFTTVPVTEIGNRVSIRYQEIDLKTHPDKRQFRYQLERASGEKIGSGVTKNRSFEWTPKEGGTYVFKVQVIDRDLNYSEPARLTFRATVPWHANAWITVPGGCAMAGVLVWGFVARLLYLRKRREADRLQERARIAADLHDQLGAGLTHLAMLGDFLRQRSDQPAIAQSLAARLSESAYELSGTVGQVIWATDPAKDTLRSFVSFVSSYAEKFLGSSAMRLRLDFPVELPDVLLPAKLRHHLFMVVKESLNNAAKHAQASEVRIKLELFDQELRLTLEDNGRGFRKSDVDPECHGLVNMDKRLKELGGHLEIDTAVGRGTRIQAQVPLARNRGGGTGQ